MGLSFNDDAQIAPTTADTVQPNKSQWRVLLERSGATTPRNLSMAELAQSASYRTVRFYRSGQVTPDFNDVLDLQQQPLNNPFAMTVIDAQCNLSVVSASDVSFELYTVDPGTLATKIGATYTISAGNHTVSMAGLVGTAIASDAILAMKVTAGAVDAKNLTVQVEVN